MRIKSICQWVSGAICFYKQYIGHGAKKLLASKTKSRIIWVVLSILAICLWGSKTGYDVKWFKARVLGIKKPKPVAVYQKFYRVKVNVTVDKKEPVLVDFVLGCRTKLRLPKSEWSRIRYVRVPLVFGVKTKGGHGVLVEGPAVCNSDLKKRVPDNYLPAIFFASDADNLEHMTAYLTERAYDQPVSRLTFHKATIEEVDKQYFENWNAAAPPNIVPFMKNNRRGFFSGGNFPKGDSRSRSGISCSFSFRIPFSKEFREEIKSWWPKNRPKYWVPKKEHVDRLFIIQKQTRVKLAKAFFDRYRQYRKTKLSIAEIRDNERAYGFGQPFGGAHLGYGIRRPNGGGALYSTKSQAGLVAVVPYHTDIIKPPYQLSEPLQKVGYYFRMANGADQGFGDCQRGNGVWALKTAKPTIVSMFIDGKLVGSVDTNYPEARNSPLIERDEFFFVVGIGYGIYNREYGEQQ